MVSPGLPPLISALGLCKQYGPVVALSDVAIELVAGSIHAIVGENGAGKSTLAKCIAGAVKPDSGTILVDGREVQFAGRLESLAAGVGYVPQSLSLVGALTLAENLMLGRDQKLIDRTRAHSELKIAMERLATSLPLDVPTVRLSLAERQLSEIALALAQGARVLLLDEPTSTLGPIEIERLITCMSDIARSGIAVGLVTHRIVEVLDGADQVTVLRGGKLVYQGATQGISADAMARLMVGDRSRSEPTRARNLQTDVRLRARGVYLNNEVPLLTDINLDVHRGEIVGVAGVAGLAQPALAAVLAGVLPPTQGTIELDGQDISGDAMRAADLHLSFVPDSRDQGLAAERTVAENAVLMRLNEHRFSSKGLRRPEAEKEYGTLICLQFDVQPPRPELLATALSGGNQQKLMVGREIDRTPAVLVIHGPTQGLDLAAASAVRAKMVAAAEAGAAVVVISADLDEILAISDRVVVLAGSRISDVIEVTNGKAADMARLGRAMAGSI